MKLIKRILYFIVALLVVCGLGILVCALNPALTAKLAEKVQQMQAGTAQPDAGQNLGFTPVTSGNGDGEKYVVPDSYPQEIPEGVSGLVGYQPVTAENEQIAQEEADNLSSILAPGETGEGLTFSAEYYPYYAMLDDTLKTLWQQLRLRPPVWLRLCIMTIRSCSGWMRSLPANIFGRESVWRLR